SYQAVNSNGHKLLETGVLKEQGIDYPVKARVEWIDLSSHAGRDDIVKYIDGFRSTLKDVIIVHGSPQDAKELAARIREVLGNDVRVHLPANGETVNTYL
ncbi:MAG: MBL fold metallo-hydrolase RNA specificity domain-containing protein, partial [Desulfurococcaceae archaeon]